MLRRSSSAENQLLCIPVLWSLTLAILLSQGWSCLSLDIAPFLRSACHRRISTSLFCYACG